MSQESSPIPGDLSSAVPNSQNHITDTQNDVSTSIKETLTPPTTTRSNRPSRACTIRAAARLYSQAQPVVERKAKAAKKEQRCEESLQQQQCSKIVTSLVEPPSPSQLPRWNLRSMWELASILNFLHVFWPLLNIPVEFSAEEFETALLTPNDTLSDIHIPILKAIPPITRMALTRDTWITALCRKLRDWWHWVADGDLPIVASHGAEIGVYKSLDPGIRVVILKALCDIRVEFSTFRKERIGGDSQGISYWYEDDPVIGHRLYREIRKIELKKAKAKGSQVLPTASYQWEAVATNFDEFQEVSEKLFSSKSRTEASLGKKLKIDMLPEIEKVHKKKERLLKKQHRQALLLDSFLGVDGLAPGRSLRGRKKVTYTFDDYDRSINEAIKITKREVVVKPEALTNGKMCGPSHDPQHLNFHMPSPGSPDYDDAEYDHKIESLDRSNRRRQRPQRYSEKEFVEAVSDNDADFNSDDDIVGEAVYDEEYLQKRKQRMKFSSSSEGDEEYPGDEEYRGDEEHAEDEEEDEDSLSNSEDSEEPRKFKKLPGRTRRETKLRSVDEIQSGLRRSKRAMRNRINYRRYELSESETESMNPEKSNSSGKHSDASENGEYHMESPDSDGNDDDDREMKVNQPVEAYPAIVEKEQNQPPEKSNSPGKEEEGMRKRRFLDLNELAPSSGFDDGPNTIMKDEDNNDI
ncbi:DDT domain-containing protein DDR4-like [Quillaja saponaria]|uniref:DDT domain-containing protein DDR4-like n=1 Tax=Quillaja saponaria TaxID=32244 RepID=A0AAD7KUE1_QUISA|nr:DDT domain-containing protein DDR4-like [Quillaja saponaria]